MTKAKNEEKALHEFLFGGWCPECEKTTFQWEPSENDHILLTCNNCGWEKEIEVIELKSPTKGRKEVE